MNAVRTGRAASAAARLPRAFGLLRSGAVWLLAAMVPLTAGARAQTALEGHGGAILSIAPAGNDRVLTASFDNSVGVWSLPQLRDGAGGERDPAGVRWLKGHLAAVKDVVAIDEASAASAGDDFTVIVWDLAASAPRRRLEGHRGSVAALAVSPDGALLASAGWDGRIGLWDVATGANLTFLNAHDGAVNDVAFADDDTLYSASADGTVRSFDVGARRERRIEVRHGFAVNRIALDAAAGWLAYGAVDGGTRVIALADGAALADLTLGRRPILALAPSPSGDALAVGDGEGHVMVVSTQTWEVVHDFRAAARGPVWALAYLSSHALVAGGIDNSAHVMPASGPPTPVIGGAVSSFLKDPATMDNGERQFQRKCSVCHTLTGAGERRAGPTFAGLFGRRSGTVPGFAYSDTLAKGDIVWNAQTLDALFDIGPAHYVPGSHMPMQRIVAERDRADLIEYLRQNTNEEGG